MRLKELHAYCNLRLQISDFDDYCPNGLQVEVQSEVQKIVTGVTASLEMIEAAADVGADTLLVHHGYFWKNEGAALTGMKGARIKALYDNGINLLAYHLPLDAHPQLGNNKQLGELMGWHDAQSFEKNALLWSVEIKKPISIANLSHDFEAILKRKPLCIEAENKSISKIAWCTGAAQGYIEEAAAAKCDVYISGEISETTFHQARELGIHYVCAGHHATERYGIQALGRELEEKFDIQHQFIDIHNPV